MFIPKLTNKYNEEAFWWGTNAICKNVCVLDRQQVQNRLLLYPQLWLWGSSSLATGLLKKIQTLRALFSIWHNDCYCLLSFELLSSSLGYRMNLRMSCRCGMGRRCLRLELEVRGAGESFPLEKGKKFAKFAKFAKFWLKCLRTEQYGGTHPIFTQK